MFIHEKKAISGFRFKQPYPPSFTEVAGQPHLGTDWKSSFEPIKAPCDGKVVNVVFGRQGGWWVYFVDKFNYLHRFAHCEEKTKTLIKLKEYKEGEIIGYSGNTGSVTTFSHTHHDISKNATLMLDKIDNFVDPEWYFDVFLPNNNKPMLPEWFEKNGVQKFNEDTKIITDWSDPFRLVPQYVLGEYIRKLKQIPMVKVYTNLNRFTMKDSELKAYKLAVRDVVRFYLPFIDLEFEAPEKSNISIVPNLKGFTPKKGINIIISSELDNLAVGESGLNGYAFKTIRTIVIDRDRLSREDEKDRGMVNGYSATLAHELCHIFGHYFSESDKTHFFDYEYTLANYLPKIWWTRLNTEDKIKFNFE